jgi:hypothetical protein
MDSRESAATDGRRGWQLDTAVTSALSVVVVARRDEASTSFTRGSPASPRSAGAATQQLTWAHQRLTHL